MAHHENAHGGPQMLDGLAYPPLPSVKLGSASVLPDWQADHSLNASLPLRFDAGRCQAQPSPRCPWCFPIFPTSG
jgi:hypothetical protein